jgi:hypothetical protein
MEQIYWDHRKNGRGSSTSVDLDFALFWVRIQVSQQLFEGVRTIALYPPDLIDRTLTTNRMNEPYNGFQMRRELDELCEHSLTSTLRQAPYQYDIVLVDVMSRTRRIRIL